MHFHTTFHKALTLLLCLAAAPATVTAQTDSISKPVVTGSLQTDILVPQEDDAIGTGSYDHSWLTNTYAEVGLQSKHIDAGLRLEYMKRPLPGFESDFNGAGLANIYAKMHTRGLEVTLGSIYEQFGSAFILRTYEERSLGVDNALMGARIVTERQSARAWTLRLPAATPELRERAQRTLGNALAGHTLQECSTGN